jgi:hypothetical protein
VFVGFQNGTSAGSADAAGAAADAGSMRRLGYLSFDSNERSNHQARELKSVHVTVEAELVRLVIHRCHVNKLNIYNQVSPARTVPWLPAHDGAAQQNFHVPCILHRSKAAHCYNPTSI